FLSVFFFFYCSTHPRDLHSFPTRRSSDLSTLRATARTPRAPARARPDSAPPPSRRRSRAPAARPAPPPSTAPPRARRASRRRRSDRKSTRLNSSHSQISYAVFCLKKKKKK